MSGPEDAGSLGEFGLIDRLAAALPATGAGDVLRGIGDDCALLRGPGGGTLAWTIDVCHEGVHFERSWADGPTVGHRAVAAAVSDLAAAGARPLALLVALEADATEEVAFLEAIYRGAGALTASLGATVAGGNVSRRADGGLGLTVTAIGPTDRMPGRAGARPGEAVWVTGRPGRARAALEAFRGGHEVEDGVGEALLRPEPRVDAGRLLAPLASALIDVSDGLAADLGHVAARSGVAVVLEADRIPVAPGLEALAARLERDARELVLAGGEDYELAFTGSRDAVDPAAVDLVDGGLAVTRIGRVEEGEGVWLEAEDGERHPVGEDGFRHF